ncbi:MAG: hypothetical protein NXI23_15245 [Bacteroidetes bacterium]|jgi:hypothetical protein|nr:hypothetical protein [Bacteroidota bacterium]
MKRFFICFTFLIFFSSLSFGQRITEFSPNSNDYIKELEVFMTSSKRKVMEEVFENFEKLYKSGRFSPEEFDQILKTSNLMLVQRMTASPYFSKYLTGLTFVKNSELGESRFKKWHEVLDQMLSNVQNRRLKPYEKFLDFSISFFERNAFRYSKTGTTWIADASRYDFKFVENEPVVEYEKMNLIGVRGKDSIIIYETKGQYIPVEQVWKGIGGKVTWERFDLEAGVYAELGEYELEVKKSLYEVKSVKMHYPLYFGSVAVPGSFRDKISTSNKASEGSYPRFESHEDILEIKNFGKGIKYTGGFRLHGMTVYGFGTKENKAEIEIFNDKEALSYRGKADLFTIRREERIVGERVQSTIYFDQDSLYHPSVNIRFEIPTKKLGLSRGQRGSDRNPFYHSMHQVNIDSDNIDYFMESDSMFLGRKNLGFQKSATPISFESLKYFEIGDYQRIQNISTTNPIALMKIASRENDNARILDANMLAERLNSRFTVENIKSLLYDLVSKGFINYDADEQKVELKDKIFHYADAAQKKVDFDVLRVNSETKGTNAIYDLKDQKISINGVKKIELSALQKVGFLPDLEQVKLLKNRDMEFKGKIFAGFTTMLGRGNKFDYDKFHIGMDSIRYFDMFIPTGNVDKNGKPEALSIGSRIEYLTGVLLVDAPLNKSGREDIAIFPSLQSKENSFVYYDYAETQGGAYSRDSFYFQLDPFSFNSLDRYSRDDIHFDGKMVSANIFPDFEETLVLQEDESLGFQTKTPDDGYDTYLGKGTYRGNIDLSNNGFQGQGRLSYLGADIDSEDLIFKPKQTTGSAERFDLEEDRASEIEVPQVRGYDVTIDWRPYKDSMYVRSKEAPFELFKAGLHTLKGLLILTPGGLKGDGLLDWDKASMESRLFNLNAFSATADTTDLKIRAFDADALALQTSNLNGNVDFDEQKGAFKANAEFSTSTLPYNQYETSFNEFDWDMKEETVTFKAIEGKLGSFLSIHPDQDSLFFRGETAFYNLRTNLLQIGGVPFIVTSDAFIYPSDGKVEVRPGGVMTELTNARILADTINKYHVINRANVKVLGGKEYRANGFYEYNIGNKKQEIEFAEIVGTRVGKGDHSTKRSVTRATGEIGPRDKFFIDYKTKFQGTISLSAEKSNLNFEGFARLASKTLPALHWFSINCEADKNDLAIPFETPKNFQGESLYTGLFLSKETATVYPRVMNPLFFRKDRAILPVEGLFQYDDKLDKFIFGDSLKVMTESTAQKGNQLIYDEKSGKINMEGKLDIGSALKYIDVEAAGELKTEFGQMVVDTLMGTAAMDSELEMEVMAGLKLRLPDNLLKIISNDFKSSTFETSPVVYAKDILFYKRSVREIFPDNEDVRKSISQVNQGSLVLPKKHNPYNFLFAKIPMTWNTQNQSFISTKDKIGLATIDGESINSMITTYIEFIMPTNEDDRVYMYIKSPSQLWYYFGYKQGVLEVVSNNTKFNEELADLKDKERIFKMDDGENFEIRPAEAARAQAFVRRVQDANN